MSTLTLDRTPSRSAHPQAWSFGLLLALLGLALGVSGLPSPLYPIYQAQWHMSPLSTTVVFAVYSIGALGSALTVGQILLYLEMLARDERPAGGLPVPAGARRSA